MPTDAERGRFLADYKLTLHTDGQGYSFIGAVPPDLANRPRFPLYLTASQPTKRLTLRSCG